MNQERFIKLKIDKYVQLYSTKTKVEEDIQTVKTTGIVNIANGGSKYPSNQTATITDPPGVFTFFWRELTPTFVRAHLWSVLSRPTGGEAGGKGWSSVCVCQVVRSFSRFERGTPLARAF